MASNSWEQEMKKWLNAIEHETKQSLNVIKNDLQCSGISLDQEFRDNFLKSGNYRLMETYERFEMVLSMNKKIDKSLNERVHSNTLESKPTELLKNFSSDVGDIPKEVYKDSSIDSNSMSVEHNILEASFTQSPSHEDLLNDNNVMVKVAELNKTEWMCFVCKESKLRNTQSFVFRSIEDLQNHWQSEHSADHPFQFHVVDLLSCGINKCRYFSTFQGLHNHHKKQHPKDIFIAIQDQRCVLCFCTGDDLSSHSCSQIQRVLAMKIFNPILFTDERIAQLQNINRKFQCKHCDSIFNAKEDVLEHHQKEHRQEAINIRLAKGIIGLICGCCQKEIAANSHEEHVEMVARVRWSKNTKWDNWFPWFVDIYLKTKVIFCNGLVVFKQNLIATDLRGEQTCKSLARRIFASLATLSLKDKNGLDIN